MFAMTLGGCLLFGLGLLMVLGFIQGVLEVTSYLFDDREDD